MLHQLHRLGAIMWDQSRYVKHDRKRLQVGAHSDSPVKPLLCRQTLFVSTNVPTAIHGRSAPWNREPLDDSCPRFYVPMNHARITMKATNTINAHTRAHMGLIPIPRRVVDCCIALYSSTRPHRSQNNLTTGRTECPPLFHGTEGMSATTRT